MPPDHDGGTPEAISREQAKALIDDAEAGTLVVARSEAVPVLGSVEEVPVEVAVDAYRFGDLEELTFSVGGGDAGGGD